jgi:hypothetical protein
MLHRQLGENRGESRTAKFELIRPQIYADSTDSTKAGQLFLWINRRKFAKSADTSDERVDRLGTHGENRQPM